MTSVEIAAALDVRYRQNTPDNRQWVVIREARSGAGFDGNNGQCDYLAINTYPSQGFQLVGHEIKVSAADWKRELADPTKAERFAKYCRRWWAVMPSALATTAKHEIPPTWGLLSVSPKGRITQIVAAPARDHVAPLPVWWWIGWLAQFDRGQKRADQALIERQVTERVAEEAKRWEERREAQDVRQKRTYAKIEERISRLQDVTGIDLRNTWDYRLARLAKVWPLLDADLQPIVLHLRQSADLLAALTTDAAARSAADQFADTPTGGDL